MKRKSNPIGIRFNDEKAEYLRTKYNLCSYQKIHDFVFDKFIENELLLCSDEKNKKSEVKAKKSLSKKDIPEETNNTTKSGLKIKRGFNYYKSIIKKIKNKEEKISINDEIVSSNDLTEEEKEKLIILALNSI